MNKSNFKILAIDDEETFRETIKLCLEDDDFKVITASSGEEGICLYEKEHPDIVITDLKMPTMNGLDVISKIKSINRNVPIILLSAFDDVNYTIEATQRGALDTFTKPINVNEFKKQILHALSKNTSNDIRDVDITLTLNDSSHENAVIGKTAIMRELIKQIGSVSINRTNILIEGENGTGKEIVARTIHFSGITKHHPFIGVNCTALSSTLLESELFGHEKGSFTGAVRQAKGKFELAGEGTLFLDEISEMSLDMQVKLLRVLQEREFERVGGEKSIPFRGRIIAATNSQLYKLVAEKKFREDLFHRLHVVHLFVPPLRNRKEDIPALVVNLLGKIDRELNKQVIKIPYEIMELLKENEWRGNVRELENTLRRAVVMAKGDYIEKEHIILNSYLGEETFETKMVTLSEAERKHIEYVLKHVNWNKHKACEILDITKPTLLKKIKEYNLHPSDNT